MGEVALLVFLGLLSIAMIYLARELEQTRAVIEPFVRSPTVRRFAGI